MSDFRLQSNSMAETRNRNISGSSLLCYDITLPVPPHPCGVLSSSKQYEAFSADVDMDNTIKVTSEELFLFEPNGSLIDVPIVQTNLKANNFQYAFPYPVTQLPEPPQQAMQDEYECSDVVENDEEGDDFRQSTYQRMCQVDMEEPVFRRRFSSSCSSTSSNIMDLTEICPPVYYCSSNNSGDSDDDWEQIELNQLIAEQSYIHTDKLLEKIKTEINKVEAGGFCDFEDCGGTPIRFSKYNQKSRNEAKQFKHGNQWKELGQKLLLQFHWNLEENDWFESQVSSEHSATDEKNEADFIQRSSNESIKKVMTEIVGVTTGQVEQLDFIHGSVIKASKILLGDSNLPDLSKYLAFSCYQQGEMQRCGYYLTESHNAFIKMDICDRHNHYMSRIDEMWTPSCNPVTLDKLELQKQRIHMLQNDALMKYGNSFAGFQRQIQYLYKNWNTIQITTDAHCFNRFGEDLADAKGMPGIWITCFAPLKRGDIRSFTARVSIQPGNTMEDDFIKLIAANKGVSEGHIADRKTYWKTRFGHNQQLREFLTNIEEWISPYIVLFPGYAKSTETREKYWGVVDKIEEMCGCLFPESTLILLYKLVENFEFFPCSDFILKKFLTSVLKITSKMSENVVHFLKNSWRKFTLEAQGNVPKRHETILILDPELERYPWDWLPIFQKTKTPVTRMLSMSHIYATIRVTKEFIYKFPRFVEPKNGMFMLNPDKTLESVQKRLQGYLLARGWNGIAGSTPSFEEFEHGVQQCDVMLYCGHGSGGSIYPDWALPKLLCRSVPILMGCSSAQPRYIAPKTYHTSIVNSYVAAVCPSLVGFLWEITDVECDRVTIDMLERWLPCPEGMAAIPQIPNFDPNQLRPKEVCLTSAVLKSKYAATQFMTEAAVVVYGLPVYTTNSL